MITVLLTGVGCPGIAGTVHMLQESVEEIRVVGVDAQDTPLGKHFCDAFYIVPYPEEESYVAILDEICARERVQVIIPQTTREVIVLSKTDPRVLTSNSTSIEIANNKYSLYQQCKKAQLYCYPQFELVSSLPQLGDALGRFEYPEEPVVIKPPLSNGMRGFRILTEDRLTAKKFLEEKPSGVEMTYHQFSWIAKEVFQRSPLLVSEYLPGEEWSVDCMKWKSLRVAIPRKRVKIRDGITFHASLEFNDKLGHLSRELMNILDLEYVFGFQFKKDRHGEFKLLECNPRVQGTMVASLLSGFNILDASLHYFFNPDAPIVYPVLKTKGEFVRYWGGFATVDNEVVYDI